VFKRGGHVKRGKVRETCFHLNKEKNGRKKKHAPPGGGHPRDFDESFIYRGEQAKGQGAAGSVQG